MHCSSAGMTLATRGAVLRSLVARYIAQHRPRALREKDFFTSMPSLELAIHHAALALDDRNPPRRYSHQCRIRLAPMRKAEQFLLRARKQLEAKTTFDDLHTFLANTFTKIPGLGVLYTYDTALRLGFFLGLEPTSVYLHAGTKVGARALGVTASHMVRVSSLPPALQVLPPHEIENFLCIFKRGANGYPYSVASG